MSAKRKTHRETKTRQNSKSSTASTVRKCTENECSNSPNHDSNCFLQVENFAESKSQSGNSNNSNVPEKKSLEGHRLKKDVDCSKITPKKKKNVSETNENSAGTKNKHKKEPLPMKLRAFPPSFWQQPNRTPTVSPGNVYCLPGLLSKEENSPENREALEEVQIRKYQEIVSEPNIDLLFSLFRNVEEEQRKASGQESAPIVRRGRPKKSKTELKVIRDDDPYLTSSAAESLLPLLPVRNNVESLQSKIAKDEQILAMVSIGGSSTLLASVTSTSQNYSQILSELVVQL